MKCNVDRIYKIGHRLLLECGQASTLCRHTQYIPKHLLLEAGVLMGASLGGWSPHGCFSWWLECGCFSWRLEFSLGASLGGWSVGASLGG